MSVWNAQATAALSAAPDEGSVERRPRRGVSAATNIEGIKAAMNRWAAGYVYLNMAETRGDSVASGPGGP
jgi:hypothetical protein